MEKPSQSCCHCCVKPIEEALPIWRIVYFGGTHNPITLGYIAETTPEKAHAWAVKEYGELFTANHGAVMTVIDGKAELRKLDKELKEIREADKRCCEKILTLNAAIWTK